MRVADEENARLLSGEEGAGWRTTTTDAPTEERRGRGRTVRVAAAALGAGVILALGAALTAGNAGPNWLASLGKDGESQDEIKVRRLPGASYEGMVTDLTGSSSSSPTTGYAELGDAADLSDHEPDYPMLGEQESAKVKQFLVNAPSFMKAKTAVSFDDAQRKVASKAAAVNNDGGSASLGVMQTLDGGDVGVSCNMDVCGDKYQVYDPSCRDGGLGCVGTSSCRFCKVEGQPGGGTYALCEQCVCEHHGITGCKGDAVALGAHHSHNHQDSSSSSSVASSYASSYASPTSTTSEQSASSYSLSSPSGGGSSSSSSSSLITRASSSSSGAGRTCKYNVCDSKILFLMWDPECERDGGIGCMGDNGCRFCKTDYEDETIIYDPAWEPCHACVCEKYGVTGCVGVPGNGHPVHHLRIKHDDDDDDKSSAPSSFDSPSSSSTQHHHVHSTKEVYDPEKKSMYEEQQEEYVAQYSKGPEQQYAPQEQWAQGTESDDLVEQYKQQYAQPVDQSQQQQSQQQQYAQPVDQSQQPAAQQQQYAQPATQQQQYAQPAAQQQQYAQPETQQQQYAQPETQQQQYAQPATQQQQYAQPATQQQPQQQQYAQPDQSEEQSQLAAASDDVPAPVQPAAPKANDNPGRFAAAGMKPNEESGPVDALPQDQRITSTGIQWMQTRFGALQTCEARCAEVKKTCIEHSWPADLNELRDVASRALNGNGSGDVVECKEILLNDKTQHCGGVSALSGRCFLAPSHGHLPASCTYAAPNSDCTNLCPCV